MSNFHFLKKVLNIFFHVFCVFILRHKMNIYEHIMYNINVIKNATDHKEKLEKPRFFGHFSDFGHF